MDEAQADRELLVCKSLECRAKADEAASLDERARWLKMADAFSIRAQEIECGAVPKDPDRAHAFH